MLLQSCSVVWSLKSQINLLLNSFPLKESVKVADIVDSKMSQRYSCLEYMLLSCCEPAPLILSFLLSHIRVSLSAGAIDYFWFDYSLLYITHQMHSDTNNKMKTYFAKLSFTETLSFYFQYSDPYMAVRCCVVKLFWRQLPFSLR